MWLVLDSKISTEKWICYVYKDDVCVMSQFVLEHRLPCFCREPLCKEPTCISPKSQIVWGHSESMCAQTHHVF